MKATASTMGQLTVLDLAELLLEVDFLKQLLSAMDGENNTGVPTAVAW